MPLQFYEEVPAVCKNKKCPSYQSFELVNVEDVLDDEDGGYIYCPDCFERIDIQD